MKINFNDINKAREVLKKFKRKKTLEEVFYDLCFCILVPQTKFEKILIVVERLKKNDYYHKEILDDDLWELIKEARYENKVKYLQEMKSKFPDIYRTIRLRITDRDRREWLVKNIKGVGYKVASQFLRNLGAEDIAIIDTHILKHFGLKDKKWKYFEVEEEMRKIAKKRNISVVEYDALIWRQYANVSWEEFVY